MSEKQDYYVRKIEHVLYEINCEGCGISTGAWGQESSAIAKAQEHGFVAHDTLEDGTLNFCPKCDVDSKENL